MSELTALIVDDEKHAREGLTSMIDKYVPDVKVVGKAASAQEALVTINTSPPDIVFLDIIMPGGNGFELLKQIGEYQFQIIFTTAHTDYAIQAIKFSALDYLLKPIDIEELKTAVERAKEHIHRHQFISSSTINELEHNFNIDDSGKVAIPTSEGLSLIQMQNIMYIKASGSYSYLHLNNYDETYMVISKRLGEFEELLSNKPFYRISRSYIINLNQVKKYLRGKGGQVVMNDDTSIEVPTSSKDTLLRLLHRL